MAGRLPQVPSNDPTLFCRLCFSQTSMHWVIRTNGTEVDQPFVNTIGECLGVWLSLSEDFPCAVCRECTAHLDQIRTLRELARMCDVALKQKRREGPAGGPVLFYDCPEDRVWVNVKPEFCQDDSDFENEPILPEVMLNETSEELVQLPKTTRLTQSEKKLALEGYFEMYTAWKESIAIVRDDDELTEEAPEAKAEEEFSSGTRKKKEAYRVRYREQPSKTNSKSADPNNKSGTFCAVCKLELRSVDRYLTHMYEKHLPGGNTCVECNQTFTTPSGLKQHAQRHKNNLLLSCEKCSLQFVNENELKGHRTTDGCRQAADQIYGKCQYCDRTFSRQGRYIFHLKRLHPDKPLPVQIGGRRKSTAGRIEQRRKSAPPARTSPVQQSPVQRSKIPQGFTDWRYRTGAGRTTIEKGRFLVILNQLTEEQLQSHQDPMPLKTAAGFHFVCIMCYGEFRELDHFNDHLEQCRRENGTGADPGPPPMVKCECDVCAAIYQKVDHFVEHLQQHARPYEVKPHECGQCMRRGSKSRQRARALSRCSEIR
uniref:PR domain zinc finger protein 14 n=1 Tax=Culex pipiens TaxID=7175 RepID=A0A8D8B3I0_CULPI